MKVPTVNKFLCVFDLTLGGLMLGYLGAISNATYALLLLIDLIFDAEKLKGEVFKIAKNAENLSPAAELIDSELFPTPITEENISTGGKYLEFSKFFFGKIFELYFKLL